ncbi:DUF4388 domain-containing protein [Stigmatella sp. ncwal1]|uniref:DUF4388 domain-containing protein n=1 Tax=Stigmatella ashevillensis TaxID=2995309 RepID=A0ABT5D2U7_9BACT|nr:DUF4388 domain-containing protein [Stigmatella ashevillena]MDC0707394.1 DUF4388 domain-containing protein [Stigmatella ashevillena]
MPGLSGDFATMPLRDAVSYLGNRRSSGVLRVQRPGVFKELTLSQGAVISASSNQPREFLGQFLINMGHLTEDQLGRAFETQRVTDMLLGKILVMQGIIPEPTVQNTLNLKFREMLLDAFQWVEGEFLFEARDVVPLGEGLDVRVDLQDIHREGEFRETAWQAIRAVFPSGKARLVVDERRLPDSRQPGSRDERLVTHIKEGLTIDEMALALHASDFYLYQRLYALYRQEAVKVREDPPPPPAAPPQPAPTIIGSESPVEEILHAARMFLDNCNFRDAEALARRAYEVAPSSQTAELLKSAETSLHEALRLLLMEPAQVPSLLLPQAQLKTMPLSAPERYLLSRINGTRDVAAIVRVSPLHELDALKYLQGFVDSGFVKLTPA